MSNRRNRGNKILTKDLEVNLYMMGQEAASRLTVAQFLSWQFLQICKLLADYTRISLKSMVNYMCTNELYCFFAIPTIFIGSIIGSIIGTGGGDCVEDVSTQGVIIVVTI